MMTSELERLKRQLRHWDQVRSRVMTLEWMDSLDELRASCEDLGELVPSVDVEQLVEEVACKVGLADASPVTSPCKREAKRVGRP